MPKSIGLAVLAMAALSIVACGKSDQAASNAKPPPKIQPAVVAPGQEMSLFPVAEGNQWVYEVNTSLQTNQGTRTNTQEATFRITKVSPEGDGKLATMEVVIDGKVSERSQWSVDSSGIYQNSAGNPVVPFKPRQLIVKFPIANEGTFSWTGTGRRNAGSNGLQTVNSKILGPQEVDTPMGRLSAIAVESESTWKDAKNTYSMKGTIWWAPNIGIVRYVQAIGAPGAISTVVLRIKSKSLKGS